MAVPHEDRFGRVVRGEPRPMPDPAAPPVQPPAFINGPPGIAPRRADEDQRSLRAVSSQAGLSALHGPRNSYSSVPGPGQPGSRFNPIVVERQRVDRPLGSPELEHRGMIGMPPPPRGSAEEVRGETIPGLKKMMSGLPDPVPADAAKAIPGLEQMMSGKQAAETSSVLEDVSLVSRLAELTTQLDREPPKDERPLSERYDYQFEQPPAPEDGEPEYGG